MQTALGYVRASTQDQDLTIEVQKERIRAYALLRGFSLLDVIVDFGVSGGTPLHQRPGGEKVIAAKVDAIIAVKLDRLFRDAADCLTVTRTWERKNVSLHLLDMGGNSLDTSSAMGRMFLTMAAGFAEMERGLIRERTKAALQQKRKQGKLAGKVPYGYTVANDGETLLEDSTEQATLKSIQEQRQQGKSFRQIATWLQANGVSTKHNGRIWHATSVRSILIHAPKKSA